MRVKPGFYLRDCVEAMREFPDKFFDLAIVDPPYGGITPGGYMKNNTGGKGAAAPKQYNMSLWEQEAPTDVYFEELFRVSKNQVVWGGNYFQSKINTDSQCWLVWDKENDNNKYADCELAWTSFDRATRIFRFMWNGMLQGDMKNKENRIHPTQKPVRLYQWILKHYAKPGDKILDTHVGSASSLIACHRAGLKYWGFEIDPYYYEMAKERLDRETAQVNIMDILGDTLNQTTM